MNLTTTLILSLAVFLGVVLLLVALLLWVRNKLMPKGKVKITINGEKELEVQPGNSLMTTLADEKVFCPRPAAAKATAANANVAWWKAGVASCLPRSASSRANKSKNIGAWVVR